LCPYSSSRFFPYTTLFRSDEYFNSAYVAENIEHWVPSGLSFYEDVYQLVPNHYISASELEQKRYYPFQNLEIVQYADAVIQFASDRKSTRLNSSHVKISYA